MGDGPQILKKSVNLPPKTKVYKCSVKGRTGLALNEIVKKNPKIPYRDLPLLLKNTEFGRIEISEQKWFKDDKTFEKTADSSKGTKSRGSTSLMTI